MKHIYFTLFFTSLIGFTIAQVTDTLGIKEDEENAPRITVFAEDLESDNLGQDIGGLLQSSRDIFVSTAGYVFGQTRFRIRGYNSENTSV